MKLNKRQRKALKHIYKQYPHPYDKDDIVEYDCSIRSQKRTCQGHRLSLTDTPLLLNLHEISDLCFSDNADVMKSTYSSLERMIDMGFIRKLPDLERKQQRLDYDGGKLQENRDVTILLYQITDKGIEYITRWRRRVLNVLWWVFNTFITVAGISLLLKLMGIVQ